MAAVDYDVPLYAVRSGRELVARSLAQQKLLAMLLVLFAALALLVTATGLGGSISYMVESRSREFGIRIALGARSETVVWVVLRQGLILSAIGLAIGMVGAAAAAQLLRGVLFGIRPSDFDIWALVAVVLGTVALVACATPAMRATQVDPANVLRSE